MGCYMIMYLFQIYFFAIWHCALLGMEKLSENWLDLAINFPVERSPPPPPPQPNLPHSPVPNKFVTSFAFITILGGPCDPRDA